MSGIRPQSLVEERVGSLAVSLAMEPDFEATSAGTALAEAADGNRDAVRRALGRLLAGPTHGTGKITGGAAEALRLALHLMSGHEGRRHKRTRPSGTSHGGARR